MIVRQHGPQAAKRARRNIDAERAQVALQERPDEIATPRTAFHVTARQKGARESTAEPEPVHRVHVDFAQSETAHVDEGNSTREGFRTHPNETREKRSRAGGIGTDAEIYRPKLGAPETARALAALHR